MTMLKLCSLPCVRGNWSVLGADSDFICPAKIELVKIMRVGLWREFPLLVQELLTVLGPFKHCSTLLLSLSDIKQIKFGFSYFVSHSTKNNCGK